MAVIKPYFGVYTIEEIKTRIFFTIAFTILNIGFSAYERVPLEIYLTPIFVISGITIIVFIIGVLVFQEDATKLFGDLRVWLTTSIALVSIMTGINVDIKRLSQFNILLAILLLLVVILFDPTLYIFRTFFTGIGTPILRKLFRSVTGSVARTPPSFTGGRRSTEHGESLIVETYKPEMALFKMFEGSHGQ